MIAPSSPSRLLTLLTLPRTRQLVRGPRGRGVALSVAIVYAFLALLAGYMLEFVPTGASGTSTQVITNPYSPEWWNYPALIVIAPGGVLVLPFFATVAMIVVAIGVGLGMGAGLIVAARVVRQWRRAKSGAGPAGSVAGLTPAMVALLTLGACCSTSAAAAAGIGAVAMASGVSLALLQVNSWYLSVFQIVVLGVALVAQEQLLVLYGQLLGLPSEKNSARAGAVRVRGSLSTPVIALRIFLVAAGTLWALAFLIELAAPLPPSAPLGGVLLGGLLQHVVLGSAAVLAGLLPGVVLGWARPGSLKGAVPLLRVLLLLCGVSVAVGVPPPLNGWGMGGLGNDLLGAAGVPGPLGGVAPAGGVGAAVGLAWAAIYALLGLFGVLLALRPGRLLTTFLGEIGFRGPSPATGDVPGERDRGRTDDPAQVDGCTPIRGPDRDPTSSSGP